MGSHLIDGEFQSDKYPSTPRGKVPLSVEDKTAQDLLWEYAQRRRAVDGEFADDLEAALEAKGFDRAIAYRPRQSGMEQQHERWIRDILNFLTSLDIPFFTLDARGNRIAGQDKDIPTRLGIVRDVVAKLHREGSELRKSEASLSRQFNAASAKLGKYEDCLQAMREEYNKGGRDSRIVSALADLVETATKDVPRWPAPLVDPPDEKGVRRHTFDAREFFLRLGMANLVHDVAPNQEICKACLGLGLIKCGSAYGIGVDKPRYDAFPYQHQWLAPCNACYLGQTYLCDFCRAPLPREKTQCNCKEAEDDRAATSEAKHQAIVAKMPRIDYSDYEGKMLYVNDEFLEEDEALDYAEAHPDAVFFACEPTDSLILPDADEVMERMQEHSTINASPEDDEDVLEFSKDARAELDAFLAEWSKKHVTARTLWYPIDRVVVMPTPPAESPAPTEAPPPDPSGS